MVTIRLLLLCIATFASTHSIAFNNDTLRVASSANFAKPVEALLAEFAKQHPHRPMISVASTGVLYQQLRHGAPFDIFFAADIRRPQLLEQQGLIEEHHRKTYAIGQIALWSNTQKGPISLADLQDYKGRIAMAAPHLAPYGNAAKQVLVKRNLWRYFHQQLITGNNINQTYQQTLTGAVDYGFISYSQLLTSTQGNGVLIDNSLHTPLEQQVVVLKNAANLELARKFYQYVLSEQGQKIIADFGYLTADKATDAVPVSDQADSLPPNNGTKPATQTKKTQ
ncbi:molybdate ABC transporter substrate-binding protein [Thalassotalea sp. HSM 43]|uniref:molybdate ABC transporter substrate-binding protein n=1 Tax=Thalassotalea sp. HSM 43 TaxID=2552945 RepID=UPI0010800881|nr:molybdate ABC transporter substrate-binding protein [Thalassotalea sp. HSM 43]QBY03625.1 molybdate ABC transporter substrate-binding protein [Thalassotalea sp. HSM 43]